MGVITGLLLLPITGPVRAFRFLLERLHEEAEAVLRDEGRAFAELIDLSMRHNAGQLSDEQYAEQETQLLERLSSIRDYRNELLYGEAEEEDESLYGDGDEGESPYGEAEEGELPYGEAEEEGSPYAELEDGALPDGEPDAAGSYAAVEDEVGEEP